MENKLPPDFKKKWTDALRSGKYKQGYGKLGDSVNGFCCLGVALLISDNEVILDYGCLLHSLNKNGNIPELIIGGKSIPNKLMKMNDTERKSFAEIADWIDENL